MPDDTEQNAVFHCRKCGRCCEGKGGIVVSRFDLVRLCRHLGIKEEEFETRWGERRGGKLHVRSEDGTCIFFTKEKGCTVHVAKPDICRAWPFFRGNLLDAESFALAKEDCAGILREQTHEEFTRHGLAFLVQKGLADHSGEDGAKALQVADLLAALAQTNGKR